MQEQIWTGGSMARPQRAPGGRHLHAAPQPASGRGPRVGGGLRWAGPPVGGAGRRLHNKPVQAAGERFGRRGRGWGGARLHRARQDGGHGGRGGADDPRVAAHRSPAPHLILLGLSGPNQVMGRCAWQGWEHGRGGGQAGEKESGASDWTLAPRGTRR